MTTADIEPLPRATRGPRDRLVPSLILHSAFFLVAGWLALATSAEYAVGLYAAVAYFLPLAVLLVGGIRAANGICGGRALLVAADLGLAVLFGFHALITGEPFLRTSGLWYAAGVGLAIAAAATTLTISRPTLGAIVRAPRDRSVLLVLIVVDVAALVALAARSTAASGFGLGSYLIQVLPPTLAGDAVLWAAWWWGSRWVLGLGGALGLVQVLLALAGPNADAISVAIVAAPNVVAIAAALVGPRIALEGAPPSAPAADAEPVRFRVVDAWLAVGAFLWPLLVLTGTFPLVSDWCVSCGPGFFGDSELQALGAFTVPLVPIVTLAAIGLGASRGGAIRSAVWLLAVSGVVVAIEIGAGLLGVARFGFLPLAAPAVILVLLGSMIGLRRPPWLAATGWGAAIGSAGLVAVWALGVGAAAMTFSVLVERGFVATSFVAAAVAAVGVVAESHRARSAAGQVAT